MGVCVEQKWKYSSAQLGLELGKMELPPPPILYIKLSYRKMNMYTRKKIDIYL